MKDFVSARIVGSEHDVSVKELRRFFQPVLRKMSLNKSRKQNLIFPPFPGGLLSDVLNEATWGYHWVEKYFIGQLDAQKGLESGRSRVSMYTHRDGRVGTITTWRIYRLSLMEYSYGSDGVCGHLKGIGKHYWHGLCYVCGGV